jgi:hypothetical protein
MMSRCALFGSIGASGAPFPASTVTCGSEERAYAVGMQDEIVIDFRRTQLLAVNASLTDAGRALFRASRITSPFASEVRALLAAVVDLERRVLADAEK